MSKNDPRTERGLAVARRMQAVGLAPSRKDPVREALELAEKALRPRTRSEPPEARQGRGVAELAAFARRLAPADLQTIDLLHARGGWPMVAEALAHNGLGPEALEVAGAVASQRGLQGLGQAVRERIAAEDLAALQAQVEPEASSLLSQLSPADWTEAERILATGGPQALAARAAELGINPAVAVVAIRTLETHGAEGTRAVVGQHVQHRERQADARQVTERVIAEAQKAGGRTPRDAAMASPEFHELAANLYNAYAARLEAAGLGLRKGESPGEWSLRMRSVPAERLAEATGESVQAARAIVQAATGVSETSELVSRLAKSDAAVRKGRAIPMKDRPTFDPQKKRDGLDEALRKAVEATGYRAPEEGRPVRAESVMDAALAMADGKKFALTTSGNKAADRFVERQNTPKRGIDGAMRKASERLESRAAPEPERPEPSGGGMSLDDAIEAAQVALGGTDHE